MKYLCLILFAIAVIAVAACSDTNRRDSSTKSQQRIEKSDRMPVKRKARRNDGPRLHWSPAPRITHPGQPRIGNFVLSPF